MDHTTSNPFFGNPYIERAAGNLIKAFAPDSRDAVNYEQAGLVKQKRIAAERENQGAVDYQNTIKGLDPSAPITADWIKSAAVAGARAGMPVKQVADMTLFLSSNIGRPVGEVARAFVGAGHAIGKDQGFSVEDREGIAKRDNDAAFARTKYSSDSSAGATIRSAEISNSGAKERKQMDLDWQTNNPTEDRVKGGVAKKYVEGDPAGGIALLFKPDHVTPGQTVMPAPGDPRYPDGSVTNKKALPPVTTPSGSITHFEPGDVRATGPTVSGPPKADRFVVSPDPGSPSGNSYQPVSPGLPAPATKEAQPHMVTPNELADLEYGVLSNIGMWDQAKKGPNAAFVQEYGAKMDVARVKASEVLQKTRDAGQAMRAYMEALGIAPGATVETPGTIARTFGGAPNVRVTPPAGAGGGNAAALQEARDAIARGADRGKVMQRLKQNGIDPAGL